MSYTPRFRRFRSNRKRLRRIRWTGADRRLMILLTLLVVLSMIIGGWLGISYHE